MAFGCFSSSVKMGSFGNILIPSGHHFGAILMPVCPLSGFMSVHFCPFFGVVFGRFWRFYEVWLSRSMAKKSLQQRKRRKKWDSAPSAADCWRIAQVPTRICHKKAIQRHKKNTLSPLPKSLYREPQIRNWDPCRSLPSAATPKSEIIFGGFIKK